MSETSSSPSCEGDALVERVRDEIERLFGGPGVVMSDTLDRRRTKRDLCRQIAAMPKGRMKRIPVNMLHRHVAALLQSRLIEWVDVPRPSKHEGGLPSHTGSYYQLTELGRRAAAGEGEKTDAGRAAVPAAGPAGPDAAGLDVPPNPAEE